MVPPRPIRKPANTRATSHRPRRNHFSDRRNTLLIRLILLVRLLSSICRLPSAICRLSIDQSSIIDDLIHHHSHLPTTIRSRVSPSRSEERRVGKECVSTCSIRLLLYH